jgi:hypothetical protein
LLELEIFFRSRSFFGQRWETRSLHSTTEQISCRHSQLTYGKRKA